MRRTRSTFSHRSIEEMADAADRQSSLLNIRDLARFVGRNRGTITDWITKGCPVVDAGGPGRETLLDPSQVFAWREKLIREEEASKYPSGPAAELGVKMTPADMLKMEQLKLTRLKVGQQAEILIPRALAEAAFERCLGLVRQAVMAIPERIVRDMAGFPETQKLDWRDKALAQCRAALGEGAKAISDAMERLER